MDGAEKCAALEANIAKLERELQSKEIKLQELQDVKKEAAIWRQRAEKLKEKLTYGQVEEDVVVQCNRLVASVLQRDYATASAVQVALVNSHWAAHKDWLKGVKFLCQLAQKKMQ